jgi:hypothetical protein
MNKEILNENSKRKKRMLGKYFQDFSPRVMNIREHYRGSHYLQEHISFCDPLNKQNCVILDVNAVTHSL